MKTHVEFHSGSYIHLLLAANVPCLALQFAAEAEAFWQWSSSLRRGSVLACFYINYQQHFRHSVRFAGDETDKLTFISVKLAGTGSGSGRVFREKFHWLPSWCAKCE
jgi:hypothetical protein